MTESHEPRLLSPAEVAALLHLSIRTVQLRGQRWLSNARTRRDALLPSSPRLGLRPTPVGPRKRLYDLRDVQEYLDNSSNEAIGEAPTSWRRGGKL